MNVAKKKKPLTAKANLGKEWILSARFSLSRGDGSGWSNEEF
jgi:hypothetical protein